jgi:hypothetical protein
VDPQPEVQAVARDSVLQHLLPPSALYSKVSYFLCAWSRLLVKKVEDTIWFLSTVAANSSYSADYVAFQFVYRE